MQLICSRFWGCPTQRPNLSGRLEMGLSCEYSNTRVTEDCHVVFLRNCSWCGRKKQNSECSCSRQEQTTPKRAARRVRVFSLASMEAHHCRRRRRCAVISALDAYLSRRGYGLFSPISTRSEIFWDAHFTLQVHRHFAQSVREAKCSGTLRGTLHLHYDLRCIAHWPKLVGTLACKTFKII